MCTGSNAPAPQAPPPPPPPADEAASPLLGESAAVRRGKKKKKNRRRGVDALRIDVAAPTQSGLNVPGTTGA